MLVAPKGSEGAAVAYEPINIFSHRIDPHGVVARLRDGGADVEVVGPEDDWQQIVVVFPKKGLFRKGRVLTFGHNAEYYDGPDWPQQIAGMQGYFGKFPDCPAKAAVLRLIQTFRFCLSVPQHDLKIDSDDERLKLVYAVCQHLDGAIFTPSSLRDAAGRILIDAAGFSDPHAVMPQLPPALDHPDAIADREDETGDEEERRPPSPERVARRALALTAVAARATLELDAPHLDDADSQRLRMLSWIDGVGIGEELEPDEWKVLQRPAGSLDERAFIDSMWRVEGLAVLAWALQLHPLPPYDELVAPPELYQAIGLFDVSKGRRLLCEPCLRSSEELAEMQAHLLAFHWRLRDFSLRPEAMDFVAFAGNCWFGSFDITRFRVIDQDLAIGDCSICRAPQEAIQTAQSTAMERHLAINWLMGDSDVYSETDTST